MSTDTIYLLIILVPTALFILIFGLGLLFGVIRGFRKSLILGIQALIAFAIVFTLFMIFIVTDPDGKRILSVINTFMGQGGLQKALSNGNVVVDPNTQSLKEVLIDFLPQTMNASDAFKQIIVENGAYLMTLVNFVIRFAYAIVAAIIYLILVLIFYLIYLIFYPERRHKRKIERKFERLERDKPYKKRRLLGMLIGSMRGLISGLLILSFLGSIMFIAVGSNGARNYTKEEKVEFSDPEYSKYYNLYRAICSYGSNGIYKVLGSIKNQDQIPYYLYLTEMFYSGTLTTDDGKFNNTNIWMVEEMGAYTKFTNDLADLIVKYGFKEFDALLMDMNNNEKIEALANKFKDADFQRDYEKLIDDFEAKTYFSSFSLSLIDSVAIHIDELTKNMNTEVADLLKIMFSPTYVCEKIGEQKGQTYAHFTASEMVSEKDAKNLLKAALPLLVSNIGMVLGEESPSTLRILGLVKQVIPEIKKLSILSDADRKSDVNKVLERIYQYVDKMLAERLNGNSNQAVQTRLLYEKESNVDWIGELNTLLDTAIDVISIGQNILPEEIKSDEILGVILDMFNTGDEAVDAENKTLYARIKNNLANSRILSLALSTSYLQDMLLDALSEVSTSVYLPIGVELNETKDEAGNVVHGEIYKLLDGVEFLLKDPDAVANVKQMLDNNVSQEELVQALGNLAAKNEDGESVFSKFLESAYLRGIVSGVIIDMNNKGGLGEFELYLPDSVFEKDKDGNKVNMIKKQEFDALVDNLKELTDLLMEFTDKDSAHYNDVSIFINSDSILGLLDSTIIEGTVANVLIDKLSVESTVVIPDRLLVVENWLSHDGVDGEVKTTIKAIKGSGFDISVVINGGNIEEKVLDELENLDDEEIETLLTSTVIHYTISDVIKNLNISDIKLIIPESAKVLTQDKVNNVPFVAIKKNEVSGLLSVAKVIVKQTTTTGVVKEIIENKDEALDNQVLLATTVNYIANSDALKSSVTIPSDLLALATEEKLATITTDSPWKTELSNLFDAINELVDLSDETVKFDETLSNKIVEGLKDLNKDSKKTASDPVKLSKLDVCFSSVLIKGTITKKVEEALGPNGTNPGVVSAEALAFVKEYAEGHDEDNDYLFIKKSEFVALVDTMNILNIDLSGQISVDDVAKEIFDLNDKFDSTSNDTKLDRVYSSVLIAYIFTSKLDGIFTSELVLTEARDSSAVKEALATSLTVYKKDEVATLINVLNDFEIDDLQNFDKSSIKAKIASLNAESGEVAGSSKLHVLYSSNLLEFVLAKQLDSSFTTSLLSEAQRDSASVKTNVLTYKVYKETEIKTLIDVLNDLSLDIEGLDPADIKSEVANLNGASTQVAGKSKLNVLYSSNLLKFILTKQLDNSFTTSLVPADQRDSSAVKETLATFKVYKETEIKTLIDVLNDLSLDMDTLDPSAIKAEVANLNDASSQVAGKTKLNVLYSANILKFILTKQLDNSFTTSLVAAEARDDASVKETLATFKVYQEEEIEALINVLDEFVLDLDNFDGNVLKNQIKSLNDISTVDATMTRLELVYSSDLLVYVLNKQLDGVFTSTLVATEVRDSSDVKTGSGAILAYKLGEIEALINVLNELNIAAVDELNEGDIKDEVPNLNSASTVDTTVTKLDIIYGSYILTTILSEQLDNVFTTSLLPNDARDDASVKATGAVNKTYKQTEVAGLINVLSVFTITNLDDFDADKLTNEVLNLTDDLDNTDPTKGIKLDVLYQSNLIKYVLNKQLDDSLEANVREEVLTSDYLKEGEGVLEYYDKDQVAALIIALKSLGLTNIGNVGTGINMSELIKTVYLDKVYDSIVVADIVYLKLHEVLDSNDVLVDHAYAKDEEPFYISGLPFYKEDELQAIQNFMIEANIADMSNSGFNISKIKLEEDTEDPVTHEVHTGSISYILNSYILMATISKNLLDNATLTIPAAAYDETGDLITFGDLQDLLIAMASIGPNVLEGFDAATLTPNGLTSVDKIVASSIMRANITKNITNGSKDVYVGIDKEEDESAKYAERVKDIDNNYITILTATELNNIIEAFKLLTDGDTFDANVSFAKLMTITIENQKKILKSNVMLHVLSDIILTAAIGEVRYDNLRIKVGSIDVMNGTDVELTYTFADVEYLEFPHRFKPAIEKDVYTLDGENDKTHDTLSNNDILAFIYFGARIGTTYIPTRDFALAS